MSATTGTLGDRPWEVAHSKARPGHVLGGWFSKAAAAKGYPFEVVTGWVDGPSGRMESRTGSFASPESARFEYDRHLAECGSTSGCCEIVFDQRVWLYVDIDLVLPSAPRDPLGECRRLLVSLSNAIQSTLELESAPLRSVFTCNRQIGDGKFKVSMRVFFKAEMTSSMECRDVMRMATSRMNDGDSKTVDFKVYASGSTPTAHLLRLYGAEKVFSGSSGSSSVLVYNKELSMVGGVAFSSGGMPVAWATLMDEYRTQKRAPVTESTNARAPKRQRVSASIAEPAEKDDDDAIDKPTLTTNQVYRVRKFVADAMKIGAGDLIVTNKTDDNIMEARIADRTCFGTDEHHSSIGFCIKLVSKNLLVHHCFSDKCKGKDRVICTTYDEKSLDKRVREAWGDSVDWVEYPEEVKWVEQRASSGEKDTNWDGGDAVRVVGLCASCGGGKSSAMARQINGKCSVVDCTKCGRYESSLYVCCRVSQASAWKDAVNKTAEGDGDGVIPAVVSIYGSHDGWEQANHIACTYQSIHKICGEGASRSHFDVIYIDEAVTTIGATIPDATTNRDRIQLNLIALTYFMRKAKKVIYADAHLSSAPSIAEFHNYVFGDIPDVTVRISDFKHNSIAPDVLLMNSADHEATWTENARASLSGSGLGYVCSADRKSVEVFDVDSAHGADGTRRMESFTSNTPRERTLEVWKDPDFQLQGHSGFTATSTIAVGVDCQIPVDGISCRITCNTGASGRLMHQLCCRPRNNKSNAINALVDFTACSEPMPFNAVMDEFKAGIGSRERMSREMRNKWGGADWVLDVTGNTEPVFRWSPGILVRLSAWAYIEHQEGTVSAYIRAGLRRGWKFFIEGDLSQAAQAQEAKHEEKCTVNKDDAACFKEREAEVEYNALGFEDNGTELDELTKRVKKSKATRVEVTHTLEHRRALCMFNSKPPFHVVDQAIEERKHLTHLACFFVNDPEKLVKRDLATLCRSGVFTDTNKSAFIHHRVTELNSICELLGFGSAISVGAKVTTVQLERNAPAAVDRLKALIVLTTGKGIRKGRANKKKEDPPAIQCVRLLNTCFASFHGLKFEKGARKRIKATRGYEVVLEDPCGLINLLRATNIMEEDRALEPIEFKDIPPVYTKGQLACYKRVSERMGEKGAAFDPRVTMFGRTLKVYKAHGESGGQGGVLALDGVEKMRDDGDDGDCAMELVE